MTTKRLRSKEAAPGTLLHPDFEYVPSRSTDIRKTFARIREAQRKAVVVTNAHVVTLKRKVQS